MSTDIVGPVEWFRGRTMGVEVHKAPPRDTIDGGRWQACTKHHLACDCREAEQNEAISELKAEMREIKDVLAQAAFGHPTFVRQGGRLERRRDLECRCVACDVIRRLKSASVLDFYNNGVEI